MLKNEDRKTLFFFPTTEFIKPWMYTKTSQFITHNNSTAPVSAAVPGWHGVPAGACAVQSPAVTPAGGIQH